MTTKAQSIIMSVSVFYSKGDVVLTLEEFIERMREYEQQPKIWTVDPDAKREFIKAYTSIREMILKEEPESKIACKIDDGNGIITIEAEWITVRKVQAFCDSLRKANNFEIYPRLNETLCMNIMFHDVYKRTY